LTFRTAHYRYILGCVLANNPPHRATEAKRTDIVALLAGG
jgi:hypothetical protein